jgi:iron complex outermembrane recepter protein
MKLCPRTYLLSPILLSILSAHADELALPEVEITAPAYRPETLENKSSAEIRDIPASIQVVKPEIIQQQGIANMTDVLRNVSGIQPADGGMANDFRARGLGVTFFRDNIFDGNAQNGYYRSLVDIQEIEVQKGPGSALFGSSAPGASINLVTKKPQHQFSFNAGATVGSFATRNAFADVTGEVAKGAAGRLIVNTEKSNGYRGVDRELLEFLPSISFDLAENRVLLLDIDYRKSQITPDNYGIPFDFQRNIADVDIENRYYTPFANVEQTVVRTSAEHDWHINDALQMKTSLVFDTRDLDILRNVRGNAQNAAGALIRRSLRQQFDNADYLTLQNELYWNVKTGDIAHNLLAGLAFSNTHIDTLRNGFRLPDITDIENPTVPETTIAGLPRDESRSFDRKLKSDTYSIYVQDQVSLNNQWKLRAGLRNDHVNASDKGVEGTIGYREIKVNKDLLSGSLGLVYQPTQSWSFYTGYSKGTFNNINTKVSQLSSKQESSRQFEIGSKLNTKIVDMNVTLFHIKRENYLFDLPEAESTSDGKDTSRGLEIDFAIRPFVGLSLTGNAVLIDPTVETDVLASLNALSLSNISTKGTEPVGVSRRVYSAWANYALQSLPGLELGLGATYRSETYADALNQYQVPSFTVVDASARYKLPPTKNGQYEIGLFVKNLTNKEYFNTTTNIGAVPGDERSAFLNISYHYK